MKNGAGFDNGSNLLILNSTNGSQVKDNFNIFKFNFDYRMRAIIIHTFKN